MATQLIPFADLDCIHWEPAPIRAPLAAEPETEAEAEAEPTSAGTGSEEGE